jgi:hypothetical protein
MQLFIPIGPYNMETWINATVRKIEPHSSIIHIHQASQLVQHQIKDPHCLNELSFMSVI